MNRFDISKFSFYAVSILAVLGLSFAFGLYSAHYETIVFETVQGVAQSFRLVLEESSTLTKTHPSHFLQPAKYEGSGVTVNNATTDKEELIFTMKPTDTHEDFDYGVWINSPFFTNSLAYMFDLAWNQD